ncbi:MAG: hypothetical protein N5P05_002063 [Chroococcopsis gigantea SAG 12.99]|nr:hypothetical protein [Chlorogloea purpurea SAG 13.99]MDV3000457.1 hypothetical protein [Chroococcopsis gigantea SAG 12.99]
MRPQKYQKIDQNSDYPCPCRRRGKLQPIILTEAFGCDRCQQIFVVQENGQTIEQLASHYPYKRVWRWTGFRWIAANSRFGEGFLPVTLGIILLLMIVWLPLMIKSPSNISVIFWAILAMLLVILPALIFWLAYRR